MHSIKLWTPSMGSTVSSSCTITKENHSFDNKYNYSAGTARLFIELGLLKLQDMFKLKLLKFYYKLSYDLVQSDFQTYREVI